MGASQERCWVSVSRFRFVLERPNSMDGENGTFIVVRAHAASVF